MKLVGPLVSKKVKPIPQKVMQWVEQDDKVRGFFGRVGWMDRWIDMYIVAYIYG